MSSRGWLILDDKRQGLDYGLFLQEEYRILSNLIFSGGSPLRRLLHVRLDGEPAAWR